mgnify:CR=1 FL=1
MGMTTGAETRDLHPCNIILGISANTGALYNLTCFHDVYWAVITVMGKPNSGMARSSQSP